MKNKKLIIGLGILAVAGIGYYMWKNKKSAKSRVSNSDVKSVTPPSEMGATNTDDDSDFTGIRKTKNCCVKEVNGICTETKEVHYLTPCPNPRKGAARTIPMPSTGVCPKGYMVGANGTYCRPIPASMVSDM